MASQRQELLISKLTALLRNKAVDLTAQGSAEYAFPVSYSQEVFDALSAAGVVVLGGDLWQADRDGFASCHEGWFSDSGDKRDVEIRWREFVARIPSDSSHYVTFVA